MIVPQRFEEIPFHFARGSAYVSLDVMAMFYEKEFALYLVADGRKTWAIPVTDAHGIAHDSDRNEIVMTSGAVFNARTGTVVRELFSLD
jgi:hypothetical protein